MVVCYLCKSSEEDDIQYGDMLRTENLAVHTFCLYLSSNLVQSGQDDEGFLGFLEADIRKEAKRVALLYCAYCRKSHASIGCCNTKCRRSFHLICGLQNGASNEFSNKFESFCHEHVSTYRQGIPAKKAICVICYDNLVERGKRFNHLTAIRAPCCNNGWFHKFCLLRFAKTAGYFFKCPLCNDVAVFRKKLPYLGIYIPNQDAAWELEPNAFAELLERPNECAASNCNCRQGRTHSTASNPFVLCSTCGSTAMHRNCLPNEKLESYHCADCSIAIDLDSGMESLNNHNGHHNNYEKDDEIDVCSVYENVNEKKGSRDEKLLEISSDSNDDDGDEKIRIRRKRSLRLPSIESTDSDIILPRRRSIRKCIVEVSSSSEQGINISDTQQRIRRLRHKRVLQDLNSSEEDVSTKPSVSRQQAQRKSRNHDVMASRGTCYQKLKEAESKGISKKCNNGKHLEEMEDNNEDKNNNNSKAKQSKNLHSLKDINENNAREEDEESDDGQNQKDSVIVINWSSEETDDDPLEHFTKMIERRSNNSSIAEITRTTCEKNSSQNEKMQNPPLKRVHIQEPPPNEKGRDANNESCIAKRTRRQSVCTGTKTAAKKRTMNSLSSMPAAGTSTSRSLRPRSICATTPFERYKQQRSQVDHLEYSTQDSDKIIPLQDFVQFSSNLSQVYEKEYFSDDEECTRNYKQRRNTPPNTALNTSCIANRTRTRKSIHLDSILEEQDSQKSSSSSSTIQWQL